MLLQMTQFGKERQLLPGSLFLDIHFRNPGPTSKKTGYPEATELKRPHGGRGRRR